MQIWGHLGPSRFTDQPWSLFIPHNPLSALKSVPTLDKKQHPLLKPPRQCHKKAEQLENFAVAVRCDGCSRGEDPGAEQGPSEINIPLA